MMVTGVAHVSRRGVDAQPSTVGTAVTNIPDTARSSPATRHDCADLSIEFELRSFNRIQPPDGDGVVNSKLELAAGSTIGDVLQRFGIPTGELFIALINGRDLSLGPSELRLERLLDEGDVLALSGPVPHSWGYRAPIV